MMRIFSSPWARAVIVGLVLTTALGWIVAKRMRILTTGREIVLKTEPVDPRDLFRGHYVRLAYEISRLPVKKIDGLKALQARCRSRALPGLKGRPVLVALVRGADGYWHFAGATIRGMAAMKEGIAPADATIIRGRLRYSWCGGSDAWIAYGIERYYAPKEKAQALEKLTGRRAERQQRQPLGVILRVDASGQAAIAGLMIDGEKVYEEPLW